MAAPTDVGALGVLARVYWMFLGNLPLALSALVIADSPDGSWIADAVFWSAAGALVAVRYVDIAHLGGTTADGEPGTRAAWRRYAVRIAGIALLVRGAAHAWASTG